MDDWPKWGCKPDPKVFVGFSARRVVQLQREANEGRYMYREVPNHYTLRDLSKYIYPEPKCSESLNLYIHLSKMKGSMHSSKAAKGGHAALCEAPKSFQAILDLVLRY